MENEINGATLHTRRTLMGIAQDTMASDVNVDRRALKRWEKEQLEILPEGEAYIQERWADFLDWLSETLDAHEQFCETIGNPPEHIELGLYRSANAFMRTHPNSRMTWGEHTARVKTLALLLELADYRVKLHWIKEEQC